MGYTKVKKISDHEVRLVHQLGQDGQPYAEDIVVTTAEGVSPHRLDYLAQYDGKIGIANVSFSPGSEREQSAEVEFPE